jgi:hypothetical protein
MGNGYLTVIFIFVFEKKWISILIKKRKHDTVQNVRTKQLLHQNQNSIKGTLSTSLSTILISQSTLITASFSLPNISLFQQQKDNNL